MANRADGPARLIVVPCLGLEGQHACRPGTARVSSVPGRAVPCLARLTQGGPCRAGPAHLARCGPTYHTHALTIPGQMGCAWRAGPLARVLGPWWAGPARD